MQTELLLSKNTQSESESPDLEILFLSYHNHIHEFNTLLVNNYCKAQFKSYRRTLFNLFPSLLCCLSFYLAFSLVSLLRTFL